VFRQSGREYENGLSGNQRRSVKGRVDSLSQDLFCDTNDSAALEILQREIPDRKVVVMGIDCYDLVGGLGAPHRIGRQEPAIEKNIQAA
jgi:hypothetical protein